MFIVSWSTHGVHAALAIDVGDSAQAAMGEPSMVLWSASHAEVTFVGRMLGSALLATTAWTYSLKVRCLTLEIAVTWLVNMPSWHLSCRSAHSAYLHPGQIARVTCKPSSHDKRPCVRET